MKLAILIHMVIFLMVPPALAQSEVAKSQGADAPVASTTPIVSTKTNFDHHFREFVSVYQEWGQGIGADTALSWQRAICGSDEQFEALSENGKSFESSNKATARIVRTAMHKYLPMASRDSRAAEDKIWQTWKAIPDSEKKSMGALSGEGAHLGIELAYVCAVTEIILEHKLDQGCKAPNGDDLFFRPMQLVCKRLTQGPK